MLYASIKAILLFIAASSLVYRSQGSSFAANINNLHRKIEFINESGKRLAVEWVNPKTGDMVPLDRTLENGAKIIFDSYVNHTFVVHEASVNATSCNDTYGAGKKNSESCNIQFIQVGNDDEQVAVFKEGLRVVQHHNDGDAARTTPSNGSSFSAEACKLRAQDYLQAGYYAPQDVLEDLAACLQHKATALLQTKSEEITFQAEVRTAIASQLENHTCAEEGKETSQPIAIRTWTHQKDGTTRNVHIMHDRPASQIHVLQNFISPQECDAIQKAAQPKLHRGTVADGKGSHKLSEHRKAWQAAIKVPWAKEEEDPIARVMRRVYDYTNDAVGYNLTIEGQEDLMSIQYFGIGRDSSEAPDQYRPHCDGDCDGLPHKSGGRVATMVMYCTVPEVGGATNFQNANVYVKPEVRAAAFFSYLDPKTMKKETGFTTHSGCPVVEGTKRIAVHWMRFGVDAQNPWDSFNTLTIRKGSEEEDC